MRPRCRWWGFPRDRLGVSGAFAVEVGGAASAPLATAEIAGGRMFARGDVKSQLGVKRN